MMYNKNVNSSIDPTNERNDKMKKKVFCLLAAIVMLFTILTGTIAENGYSPVYDKANVLSNAEEVYLSESIVQLQDAYDLDIALITVNSSKKSKLESEARNFAAKAGLSNAVILSAGNNGGYQVVLTGNAEEVFTPTVLSAFADECYFPLYFEEKSYFDAFDDFLNNAADVLTDYSSRMECTIGDAVITANGKGKARITLSVSLINYSDDAIQIKDALNCTLIANGKMANGKLSFPYKSVYSLEELEGTVSFDADGTELGNGYVTIACLHAKQSIDLSEARDERTENEKKALNENTKPSATATPVPQKGLEKNGSYSSKEDVAAYLRQYGKLPPNYITKSEAERLGWDSSKGNLWKVAPGKSIGGDRFGNYEGLLPGGSYTECDIDYQGGYRDSKRLVFRKEKNQWFIYYTEDHYNTFTEVK